MSATFIGIDLAWRSERNPSGAAALTGDRSGARLIVVSPPLRSTDAVLAFVRVHATTETVLAVDAPLVIVNETGQRVCETLVGKRYGSREASCHTSNLGLYPQASSVRLTRALETDGFVHVEQLDAERTGRIILEVYPHAAMVALFDLAKTIKYKKGSVAARRIGLESLRSHLKQLTSAAPPLVSSVLLQDLFLQELPQLAGRTLKDYEDGLDALFCAYLAYYFWYWGWERNELFGDVESGYILNPKLTTD
jgi:predicted RNase H-like nuclease